MMSEPKTVPIPAPEPATPTVAAPAPMNLAAVSMSRLATETERGRTDWTAKRRGAARATRFISKTLLDNRNRTQK